MMRPVVWTCWERYLQEWRRFWYYFLISGFLEAEGWELLEEFLQFVVVLSAGGGHGEFEV